MKPALTVFALILPLAQLASAHGQQGIVTDKIVAVKPVEVKYENGWNRVLTSSGIIISLPPGWKIKLVTGKGLGQILDAGSSISKFKYTAAEKAAIEKDSGVRFMALGPEDKKVHFSPNLNIIRDNELPSGGLAAVAEDVASGLKASSTIQSTTDVILAIGHAKRIAYLVPTTKYSRLQGLAYVAIKGKAAYVLTFTLPQRDYVAMKVQIDNMASSFNVSSH